MRTVGLLRRAAAATVDAICAAAFVAFAFATGVLDRALFTPDDGWFLSEWWLKLWLDDPTIFVAPVVLWCVTTIFWITSWELAIERTPGAMLLRIEVIDEAGFTPRRVRFVVRGVALMLQASTLGFGWLWGFVSPTRRTLADVVSGTYVVSR